MLSQLGEQHREPEEWHSKVVRLLNVGKERKPGEMSDLCRSTRAIKNAQGALRLHLR